MINLKRAGFITGSAALTIVMAPGSALAGDCGSPAQDAVYEIVHHDATTEQVVDTPAHTIPGQHHDAVTHEELMYGMYTPGETTTVWVEEGQDPAEGYTPTERRRTVTDREAYDDPDTIESQRRYSTMVEDGGYWEYSYDWSATPPDAGDWEGFNGRDVSNNDGRDAWTETVDHPAETHVEQRYAKRTGAVAWFNEGDKIPRGFVATGSTATGDDGEMEYEYWEYTYMWLAEGDDVPDGYMREPDTSRTVIDTPAWTETIEHPAVPDTFYTEYQWKLWQPDYTEVFEWFDDGEAPAGWDPTGTTRERTIPGEHHPAVTHEEYEYSHSADGTTETGWFEEGQQPDGWTLPIEGAPDTRTVVDQEAWTEDDVEVPATYTTVTVQEAFDERMLVEEAVPAGEECAAPVVSDDPRTPMGAAVPAVVQTDGFGGPEGGAAGFALGGLLLAGAGAGVVVVARRRQMQH